MRVLRERPAAARLVLAELHEFVEAPFEVERLRERDPLEGELSHGDLPALVDLVEDVLLRGRRVVEVDLVELALVGDLTDALGRHTFLVHVDDEGGDAVMFRPRIVGASEHVTPVGLVGVGGPDLLAVDAELIALVDRLALEAREVGTDVGFGVADTPEFLAVQDLRQVAFLLCFGAEPLDRRADEVDADLAVLGRRVHPGLLLLVDQLLHQARVATAVLLGPVDRCPTALVEFPLPLAEELFALVLVVRQVAIALDPAVGEVLLVPLPDLAAERLLLVSVVEVHAWFCNRRYVGSYL